MSIVILGSTSGSITLQEPAVAGSNTINLPAATGTAVLTGVSGTVDINAAGSNNVTLSTNSTERVRVDSSGNVGIGTSSPTQKLSVNGSVTSTGRFIPLNGSTVLGYFGDDNTISGGSGSNIGIRSDASMLFATGGATERMRLASGGELGYLCTGLDGDRPNAVGSYKQTNGNTKVRVVSDGSAAFQFYSPTGGSSGPVGTIVPNASSVSYNTTSDYRLKENIAPMTGALEKVAKLKPCTYTWKVNGFAGQGFIAHELQEVVPDCVTGEKDAVNSEGNPVYQAVDTSFLVATLTAAIQELKGIVDTQATKIAELEAKLEGTA